MKQKQAYCFAEWADAAMKRKCAPPGAIRAGDCQTVYPGILKRI